MDAKILLPYDPQQRHTATGAGQATDNKRKLKHIKSIIKQLVDMKKYSNYLLAAFCIIAMAISAGTFYKVNAAGPAAQIAGQPVDLTYAAEKALPAVVHIKYVQNSKVQTIEVQGDPFSDFFSDPFGFFGNPQGGTRKRQVQTPKKEATGSGVIISPDGYIVTNNHVVEGADELTVTLNDNREFSARIIGTDKTTDLALIKVDGKNLPCLNIGDSEKLKVGEWVIAVGNPFGLNNTVTAGIISAKARSLGANGLESFIQTDAAINQGNSGGALVNTQGELVGINAMLYSPTGSYSGYGFAIPTTIMNKVVDGAKVDIPGIMIENKIDDLVEEFARNLQYQGLTMEKFFELAKTDLPAFREHHRQRAESAVKQDLVLEAVVKAENIEATEKDIDEQIAEVAKSYDKDVEEVKALFKQSGSYEYFAYNIRMMKALDFINDNAVIK